MRLESLTAFWKAHCDKVAALAALLALLGSLLYLAIQIGSIQQRQLEREKEMNALPIAHPFSRPVDTTAYETALDALRQPDLLAEAASTNRALFFPEERVWCIRCRQPIVFSALKCPFCGEEQPPLGGIEGRDTDGDGIPDKWERHFKLDPLDPADVHRDNDGSGFTSLEQFVLDADGKPVYDLRDPKSHPPYVLKLHLDKIETQPFPLRFEGKRRLVNEWSFQLNDEKGRTYSAKEGQYVGDEPFRYKIVGYEEKFKTLMAPGSRVARPVDVSVLTLEREGKKIDLVYREKYRHEEYTVNFHFTADSKALSVVVGETFALRNEKYRLISVDNKAKIAVVEDIRDEGKWRVTPSPAKSVKF